MKNKSKLLIILCTFIYVNASAQKPSGIYINYIPKYCYSSLLPNGTVPEAFRLKVFTGCETIGIGYRKRFNSHFSASVGVNLNSDLYWSALHRDYNPTRQKFAQKNILTEIKSSEPLLMISWHGFKSKFLERCYISTGISYTFTHVIYDINKIDFSQRGEDTFYWTTTVSSKQATNLAWHIEMGKTYKLSTRIDFELGLRIKLSVASKVMTQDIYINWKFR